LLRSVGYETLVISSAQELLSAADPGLPGCIILDFELASPEWNGLGVQSALSSSGSDRPIVFLSGRADIATSVAALRAGAIDFLTKPVNERRLLEAVREAIAVDEERRSARRAVRILGERLARLTRREREVLEHVVGGRLNKQIAGDLGTREKTIKVHRGRVMRKMGARSLAELVQLAGSAGIAPLEIRGVMLNRALAAPGRACAGVR
jgi:FixJ family two-component response regulator